MTLFAPGRRWFAAGSIATIVVAALHTIGNTLATGVRLKPDATDTGPAEAGRYRGRDVSARRRSTSALTAGGSGSENTAECSALPPRS